MPERSQPEWIALIDRLRALPRETEWAEFKVGNYKPERIGKYISGLSNSACCSLKDFGYLIWGIDDKTHDIENTDFNPYDMKVGNQLLLMWLHSLLSPAIGFDFHEVYYHDKRLVVLEIEAAYRQPVAFQQVPWIRIGSSLTELAKHPDKAAFIFRTTSHDWTAETLEGATLDVLAPEAIAFARKKFAEKHANDTFASEIPGWDDWTFLHKARMAVEGQLTKAAIILLGRPESVHWLKPAVARMTWKLFDAAGSPVDYSHFDPPFILAVDALFAKIRNITLRSMPDGTLFPEEISQYDSWVIREALHNAIAHQDYSLSSTIVVSEFPDRLVIANAGAFLPGSLKAVFATKSRPRYYPNQTLAEAMAEVKMIDTVGFGIWRMFDFQRKRFMPMPDYDFADKEVSVTIPGRVFDSKYTKLLIRRSDISLPDIILLDRLQKGLPIDREEARDLRRKGLIEGRYPHVFPAGDVATAGGKTAEYLEAKGFDDIFYAHRILQFICQKGIASRSEIDGLIVKHLSSTLTDAQRESKIGNLLSLNMNRRKHWIRNVGGKGHSAWTLTEQGLEECRKWNPNCHRKCPRPKTP